MQQVKEIWATQLPLVAKKDKAERIMALPRFRAAFDFLVLRAAAAPNLQESVDFWTKIQITHPHWLVESSSTQEVLEEADAQQLTDSHQQAEPKRRRRYRQR